MGIKSILRSTLISQQATKSSIEELEVKTLNDLNDVCINNPTNEQLLKYNATDGQWKPAGGGHTIASHNDTSATGAELEELTDGNETALHSHASSGVTYVDRGDPDGYDWIQTDLIIDNAWRDLDLSSIVPAGAFLVLLSCSIWASSIGKHIEFRKKGLSNDYNGDKIYTHVASYWNAGNILVSPDGNGVIQYRANSATYVNIVVRGWFV